MSEFGRDEKYWSERLNNAKDDIESLLCLSKLENFELRAKIAELQNGALAQIRLARYDGGNQKRD